MRSLFDLDRHANLIISPETYTLEPFKKIWDRDTSKGKEQALKELAFIYFYCDVKSIYSIVNDNDKEQEIAQDIGLVDWQVDEVIREAINFYNEKSKSITVILYEASLKAANDLSNYLQSAEVLLKERDKNGKPVTTISQLTSGLKSVPVIMKELKNAYKEVVKETKDDDGKSKGSQQFNIFETGLNFEE